VKVRINKPIPIWKAEKKFAASLEKEKTDNPALISNTSGLIRFSTALFLQANPTKSNRHPLRFKAATGLNIDPLLGSGQVDFKVTVHEELARPRLRPIYFPILQGGSGS
jgi:hypothetical protein